MSRTIRLTIVLVLLATFGFGAGAALGANEVLYLLGDGYPRATMATSGLWSANEPANYDASRPDDGPGLTVQKGGAGAFEDDPSLYQQWEFDASGSAFATGNLTIWAGAEDFAKADVTLTAFLLRCDPVCAVVASGTKSASNASTWKKLTISLSTSTTTYGPNETLVVKVIVPSTSESNAWLAFGTTTHDAGLNLVGFVPPLPSTSTTTTPSSTTTTTVSGPPGPPPTGPPTTGPERPTTTTTVQPATSTTTTTRDSTTTVGDPEAVAVAAGSGSGGDPPTGGTELDGGNTANVSTAIDEFAEAGSSVSPQQGLMVAFATTAETIDLFWQVAAALGALMTVLALPLFRGSDDFDRKVRASARLRKFAVNPFEEPEA